MGDKVFDGCRIRLLTMVDSFFRERLAIMVVAVIGAPGVLEVLYQPMQQHRLPKTIRVNNGPEFTSKLLGQWAYLNEVELDLSRPGKTTDNDFINAIKGRLRQECLSENWFLFPEDAG